MKMKTKSINELAEQYKRLDAFVLQRKSLKLLGVRNNAIERYVDNIKEFLGIPKGWRVSKTIKEQNNIKVPFKVYTR